MRIQLIVSEDCDPCRAAEKIWAVVCAQRRLRLEIVDLNSPAGREMGNALELHSVPALLLDNRLVAVGVTTKSRAHELLDQAENGPVP